METNNNNQIINDFLLPKDKIYLKECFLQKTNHYGALDFLNGIDSNKIISTKLKLGYAHFIDSNKKCVYAYKEVENAENNKMIIGLLSEEDAKFLDLFLMMGQNENLFECIISGYNEKANEDKRFSVVIFIKNKGNNKRSENRMLT